MAKPGAGRWCFDVADLVKDTLILPWAFICAKEQATEHAFLRLQILQKFAKHKALGFMLGVIKALGLKGDSL